MFEPFQRLKSGTVVLRQANIDTDQIIPARFLTTTSREGLGENAFYDWRYDDAGAPREDSPLDGPEHEGHAILVAGPNFGCGSSREHAPWALLDFGIRCVISTSFADIFYNNCFKNGILPIAVSADDRDALMADAQDTENPELSVDLVAQKIRRPNGVEISFEIDPFRKKCLLEGLDDIGLTMEKGGSIDSFEAARADDKPWL